MKIFKFNIHSAYLAVLPILFIVGTINGQDLNSKLPVDPNVLTGKLPNGLTYYIRNNHRPDHKVELRLVVKAGSILENDDQQGLAHFMEHMNFNGTKNFQKNELVSYLQSIGVQFGADLNAYTAFDQTVFILPIPTDKAGNIEKGFQIIEDWAHNSLLTDKDIDEERNVVLEESRLGKGSGMRMLAKYFPKLASGSLYADRLPIGKDTILKTFKYETIRQFYTDWYRPDLQAVAVVGDLNEDSAKKIIFEHFAKLTNPQNERQRNYVTVKPRIKAEAMVVTDKEATNVLLQIMYPYQKKHEQITVGDYVNDLKKGLVLQMINQRLNDLAQSINPPYVYAGVGFDDLVHGYECFSATALPRSDGLEKAMNAVGAELIRAAKYGFTSGELERAKKEMMSGIEKTYNERNTTESHVYVDEYIRNFLDNEPFPGIENEYVYFKKFLPEIQLGELNCLPGKWTGNPNTFTLITGPDKVAVNLPNDATLLSMTKKALTQHVTPNKEKEIPTALLAIKPTRGKVVSQQKEADFNAVTYQLNNGILVTVKSTDFKSDEILLKGIKKGGTNRFGVTDRSNVHFVTEIIDAMGIGALSPNDLEKVIAGKNISVSAGMGDILNIVSGSSNVKDFETMLQLLYLTVTEPRKDEGLFNAFKAKEQSMLQYVMSNPQASFADTIIKALYKNNPLAKMVYPTNEDFEKLNLDRCIEIYREEFCQASGYHFYLTGNIKQEDALPLIEQYIGSIPQIMNLMPGKSNKEDNGVRPVQGINNLNYYKGKEKKSLISAIYYGETPYSEDLSLKAQALAEVLNIKVIEVLREKMGGIYTGGFSASVAKEPYQRYSFSLRLPCGPENVDTLLKAANDEISKLILNGPDTKDVDKVKSQWLEKHKVSVKENGYWQTQMESVLFWGRDKAHVFDYETWVNKLTNKDIQQTAQQLFNGENVFTAILYPEKE